jgi:diamine N-acetyltransferase
MGKDKSGVQLRAVEPEDIDILYVWENDKSIWQLSNTLVPFSRYILTKYIETAHLDIFQTRQVRFMIDFVFSDKSKMTVGAIDLFDFDPLHLRAGIGILIADDADRRKGYASAALEEIIDYSFVVLQLKQLYCNIEATNELSLKLFKKFNFQEIGIKKAWLKTTEGFKDEIMLQLINDRI